MKKIISKILICIVIFIVIFMAMANHVYASTDMEPFAKYSFSTVYNYSASTLLGTDWYYDTDTDNFRLKWANFVCMRHSSANSTGSFSTACVIDINVDGNSRNSYTYYYYTGSGSNKTVSHTSGSDYRAAEMAYIAWKANSINTESVDTSNAYSAAFSIVWGSSGKGAYALFSNASGITSYGDHSGSTSSSIEDAAYTYAQNGTVNGESKSIKARILIFDGGWSQTVALLYGTAEDAQTLEINKYITSVTSSSGSSTTYSRSSLDEDEKPDDPVYVSPESIVYYSIVVKNNGSQSASITLYDTYQSGLSYNEDKTKEVETNQTWTSDGTRKYKTTFTLAAGGTKTVKIALNVSSNASESKYNQAQVSYNSKTYTSKDYIHVVNITINKYITNISRASGCDTSTFTTNGAISGRNAYDDSTKKSNAILVPPGTEVTYRIDVTVNTALDAQAISIVDSWSTDYFTYKSNTNISNANSGTLNSSSNKLTITNQEISSSSGGTISFYVVLTVKSDIVSSSSTRQNKATCLGISSYDYIKCQYTTGGTVDKYITALGSSNITGRSGQTNSWKSSYAISVSTGDVVTYTIAIKNTGNVKRDFYIEDFWAKHLGGYTSSEFSTNNSGWSDSGENIDWENGVTYDIYQKSVTLNSGASTTVTIKLKVASNLADETRYGNRARLKYKNGSNSWSYTDWSYDGVISTSLHINKYISQLDYPSSVVGAHSDSETVTTHTLNNSSLGRSSYKEGYKLNNPANVIPGTEITYTIKVWSSSTMTVTFSDTYNSNLEFESISISGGGTYNATAVSCSSYSFTPSTNSSSPTVITVKLKMKNVSSSATTTYANTASFSRVRSSDNTTITTKTSDYVKSEYTESITYTYSYISANYKKYVSAVNGVAVSGRDSYSDIESSENPVTVKNGDKVTYTLEITNAEDSSVLNSIVINDTWDSGLEFYSLTYNGTSITQSNLKNVFSSGVGIGETIKCELTLTVTKSDMYLLTLANTFTVQSGTWTKVTYPHITWTYNDAVGTSCHNHHDGTPTESIEDFDSDDLTANGNKDYVQLDDVDISGHVWIDNCSDGYGWSGYVSGVNVYLYRLNSDGTRTEIGKCTTGSDGAYTFSSVVKGNKAYVSTQTDSNGNTLTVTRKYADDSGYYNYYVEFEYDGLEYECTQYIDEYGDRYLYGEKNSGNTLSTSGDSQTGVWDDGSYDLWTKKSHACEDNISSTNRQDFNDALETVAYNIAYEGTAGTESTTSLAYTKNGSTSTLTTDLLIRSRSINLFVQNERTAEGDTICADDIDYLAHIDLGLVYRDYADLSLEKDVYQADVSINGYTATYTYNQLGNGNYTAENNKLKTSYNLNIYQEDYYYRVAAYDSVIQALKSSDDELKVTITYKITITNESEIRYYTHSNNQTYHWCFNNKVIGVVREVIDTSPTTMTLLGAEMEDGTALTVTQSSSYNNSTNGYSSFSSTNSVNYITGSALSNTYLDIGDTVSIYLTYQVNQVTDDEGNMTAPIELGDMYNIAQIGAYSIYDTYTDNDETKYKALGLIDRDSNPANLKLTDTSSVTDETQYEDDTFYTNVQIVLRGNGYERIISGNVWEDTNTKTESTTGQKYGDGVRNTTTNEDGTVSYTENGAENVLAQLLEVIEVKDESGNVTKEYLVDTGISAYTDSNGDYKLYDTVRLHAGKYVVRFIYGAEADKLEVTDGGDTIKYSGQDYKSTTYTYVGTSGNDTETIELTQFVSTYNSKGEVSTAKDNELRRLEVINYSTTMSNELDNILKGEDLTTLATNTAMYADTKNFNVQVEYYGNYTSSLLSSGIYALSGLTKYTYESKQINFGIIERPETKLVTTKDISQITALTSDGETLVDLIFDVYYYTETDDEGNETFAHTSVLNEVESAGYSNVQILNRSGSNQGFRYVNVDSELLQGMTVIVKYQIGVANTSDIDTSNQNLINLIEDDKLSTVMTLIKVACTTSIGNGSYYGMQSHYKYSITATGTVKSSTSSSTSVNDSMYTNYSFVNLSALINNYYNALSGYGDYKLNTTTTNEDGTTSTTATSYKSGYFLGNIYYNGSYSGSEQIVETRVDQVVDYVDNDLILSLAANTDENGNGKFVSYTISEIATLNNGLLAGVKEKYDAVIAEEESDSDKLSSEQIEALNSIITDGESSYVVYDSDGNITKNNLAFSIESNAINGTLYKYLKPISTATKSSSPATYAEIIETTVETVETTSETENAEEIVSESEDTEETTSTVTTKNVTDSSGNNIYPYSYDDIYTITIQASRTLSSESDIDGLTIDNIAEIVKVSNTVGRKVYVENGDSSISAKIGNSTEAVAQMYASSSISTVVAESDTDYTEYITFSPPTGLSNAQVAEQKTVKVVFVIVILAIIAASGLGITIKLKTRKKFYR